MNISATLRIAGALEKSTDVMKSMQALIKIPEIQATMREMSKEMMKVSYCYLTYILIGDRRQAWQFYLAKQFCFLDADCLVVGESRGSSGRSIGKYPVKPPCLECDS